MKHLFWSILAVPALAQTVMPTPDRTVNRSLPEDNAFTKDTEFQRKFHEIVKSEAAARAALREGLPVESGPKELSPKEEKLELPKALPKVLKASASKEALEVAPATPALVFAVSKEAELDQTTTVLPAGSFVKARVVSGVEANTLEPYPVLLQLEYAFTGPNQSKIDLSNCFMIAKARANLSTERVIMETDTLSCVRENGEHFKTSARGYTAGSDSTFG